eukprot:1448031-Pyramimonas_sp.AAC.1
MAVQDPGRVLWGVDPYHYNGFEPSLRHAGRGNHRRVCTGTGRASSGRSAQAPFGCTRAMPCERNEGCRLYIRRVQWSGQGARLHCDASCSRGPSAMVHDL